jgi:hypothetical protein
MALLERQGFTTVTEFARAYPRDCWVDLAGRLDEGIPPAQLQAAIMCEMSAKGPDGTIAFAMQSLVRYLHEHFKDGWSGSGVGDFESAWCFGDWSASLGDELKGFAEEVWDAIVRAHPPAGWLPGDSSDEYLVEAMRNGREVYEG